MTAHRPLPATLVRLGLLAALATTGCFVFADDIADRGCASDSECFRAQGETCDKATRNCVVGIDAGPRPDAQTAGDIDAGDIDAGDIDAGDIDAGGGAR